MSDFSEAREALYRGDKIRHDFMPDSEWIVRHYRGFGDPMLMILDQNGNISNTEIDFNSLFWATLKPGEEWEIYKYDQYTAPR